ncbi:hypothetical protein [Streptomyces sp. NBC_01565]|uniref:hypothetical protein n=1 Tax=Streptomyces sp. NBC_01565 TaxID=2975881 RepID=UPI00224FFFE0|nr:hypothetical protein [Streptomyces sp. NBC_01565]MCX4547254.1 hypothetical protein [Streptomyces sp. NBC_01565]
MDLTKTPGQLATEAADAIRALNHRTLDKGSYDNPAEAGAAAYALRTLVERLPQSLTQLGTALTAFDDDTAIRTDDGSDATYSVAECLAAIEAAHEHLGQLLGELAIVSARTSHMGGHWSADEDDVDAE